MPLSLTSTLQICCLPLEAKSSLRISPDLTRKQHLTSWLSPPPWHTLFSWLWEVDFLLSYCLPLFILWFILLMFPNLHIFEWPRDQSWLLASFFFLYILIPSLILSRYLTDDCSSHVSSMDLFSELPICLSNYLGIVHWTYKLNMTNSKLISVP